MGEDAEEILASTNISYEYRKKYDKVLKQYDDFFRVWKNVIFWEGCQAAGESVEQFITSLYTLIENCDYRDLKDQMIRNWIVVGIRRWPKSFRTPAEWTQIWPWNKQKSS